MRCSVKHAGFRFLVKFVQSWPSWVVIHRLRRQRRARARLEWAFTRNWIARIEYSEECTAPGDASGRQGSFPDGSRSFEEIDHLSIGAGGTASQLSSIATVDFYRGVSPLRVTECKSSCVQGLRSDLVTGVGGSSFSCCLLIFIGW
jgi:hypothetical protein